MKTPLLKALKERVLVANGAMGSMLAARGLRLTNSATANITAPDIVAGIMRDYRQAGADILQSNSFAASMPMLQAAGMAEHHDEINRQAMQILHRSVDEDPYLLANMGPTGEMLAPLGRLEPAQAQEFFRQQAEVLLSESPDGVLLETFEALDELEAAVAGVREVSTEIPLLITFSFSQANGRSMMGVSGEQAARAMREMGADVIGANCGLPEALLIALREISAVAGGEVPLMAQFNAGVPRMQAGETVFDGSPADLVELGREAVDLGARIVGGCCGTTPEHIRELAAGLNR